MTNPPAPSVERDLRFSLTPTEAVEVEIRGILRKEFTDAIAQLRGKVHGKQAIIRNLEAKIERLEEQCRTYRGELGRRLG